MTSKTSSPIDLSEALISHEYNDVTGAVAINVTDALMAIAAAVNRLATVQEKAAQHAADRVDRIEAMIASGAAVQQ